MTNIKRETKNETRCAQRNLSEKEREREGGGRGEKAESAEEKEEEEVGTPREIKGARRS